MQGGFLLVSCFTPITSSQEVVKVLLLLFQCTAVCVVPLLIFLIKEKQQIHLLNH